MTVVLSLGGSVLAPGLSSARIREYAHVVEEIVESGESIGIVVGGGTTARKYIGTARDLGANEISLDAIGIEVTRLNARLLIAALDLDVAPRPAPDYETGKMDLQANGIAVLGGVSPGHTTDAVSAAFAEFVEADQLVYATSVPGVFDADPNEDQSASRFEELSAGELIKVIGQMEMNAGSPAPVDLTAAKLIQRAEMPTIVIDGSDPATVREAVIDDRYEGTTVVPDEQ